MLRLGGRGWCGEGDCCACAGWAGFGRTEAVSPNCSKVLAIKDRVCVSLRKRSAVVSANLRYYLRYQCFVDRATYIIESFHRSTGCHRSTAGFGRTEAVIDPRAGAACTGPMTLPSVHLSHKWILDRHQFSSPFHGSLCMRRPVTGGKATTEHAGAAETLYPSWDSARKARFVKVTESVLKLRVLESEWQTIAIYQATSTVTVHLQVTSAAEERSSEVVYSESELQAKVISQTMEAVRDKYQQEQTTIRPKSRRKKDAAEGTRTNGVHSRKQLMKKSYGQKAMNQLWKQAMVTGE